MTNTWKATREHRMALVVDETGATVAIIAEGDSYEAEDERARFIAAAPALAAENVRLRVALAEIRDELVDNIDGGLDQDSRTFDMLLTRIAGMAESAIAAATSSASP